ncbi:MAG: hypothetical protein AAF602_20165, partial [Myxococcota bacterium]
GGETLEERLDRNIKIFKLIKALYGLSGLGGKVWLELEIQKAKVVAYATIAISDLEGWGTTAHSQPTPDELIEAVLCSTDAGGFFESLSVSAREAIGLFEAGGGALGTPPSSVCP